MDLPYDRACEGMIARRASAGTYCPDIPLHPKHTPQACHTSGTQRKQQPGAALRVSQNWRLSVAAPGAMGWHMQEHTKTLGSDACQIQSLLTKPYFRHQL